jgi:hypothetical protein
MRISINRSGWRAVAIGWMVVVACLLAALLSQAWLFERHSSAATHPEPLTTLALVLAILAFLVQLFVFAFQTKESSRAVQRSEELQSQTSVVLKKIEANSEATKAVLFSQFDRLLEYIVGPRRAAPAEPVTIDAEDNSDDLDAPALTASQVRQMISDAMTRAERPAFFSAQPPIDTELQRRLTILNSWPTRKEAEEAVALLRTLSPLALATLASYARAELELAKRGESPKVGARSAMNSELLDAGLIRIGESPVLTDRGRAHARILPIGFIAERSRPDWAEEVRAPLLEHSGPTVESNPGAGDES